MDNGHILALTGAELDAALARAQKALPRDGSAPMTGPLISEGGGTQSIFAAEAPCAYINVYEKDDWDKRRTLMLSTRQNSPDIKTALALCSLDDGTWRDYHILHTGNKPSGSYTGNGSATSRTINVGGIGAAILVQGNGVSSIVTANGAFILMSGDVSALALTSIKFVNGVLTIATNHGGLNGSDVNYTYQVI